MLTIGDRALFHESTYVCLLLCVLYSFLNTKKNLRFRLISPIWWICNCFQSLLEQNHTKSCIYRESLRVQIFPTRKYICKDVGAQVHIFLLEVEIKKIRWVWGLSAMSMQDTWSALWFPDVRTGIVKQTMSTSSANSCRSNLEPVLTAQK